LITNDFIQFVISVCKELRSVFLLKCIREVEKLRSRGNCGNCELSDNSQEVGVALFSMSKCEGLPDGQCPAKKNDATVRLQTGQNMGKRVNPKKIARKRFLAVFDS